MKVINITPHTLNIHLDDNVKVIPPSGTVARVTTTSKEVARVNGIAIYSTSFGEIVDLPPIQGIEETVARFMVLPYDGSKGGGPETW